MGHTPRVRAFVSEYPWAILPATLNVIVEIMEMRAHGHAFTDEEIRARIGTPAKPAPRTAGTVAVIPLHGMIAPKANVMTDISGGTSAESFGAALQALVLDPAISAIAIDVDSPGGSVFGIEELADTTRALRGRKPIIAVANHMMASAAYWIASQADEIIASPSSHVGSIGVIAVHQDVSAAEEKLGVRTTLITAGKHKGDGHPSQPLSDEARATMQALVDRHYAALVSGVAKGRGVPVADVRDGYGEGRIVSATDAVKLGLADGIGTLAQVVERLAAGAKSVAGMRAEILEEVHTHTEPLKITDPAITDEVKRLREAVAARA